MAGMEDFFGALDKGVGAWQDWQSLQNANDVNSQVMNSLGQNAGTLNSSIQALQDQINQGRVSAQQAYDQAKGLYDPQNAQLQSNIDTMSANLTALNDPNSPYMQMMRQKLERSDAAAGRRSQAGEREVQLAAALADYVGKYAPGINNSITTSRNQITQNQNSLADLYARMQGAGTSQQQALNQMMQQQQQLAAAQNTTGRQAGQSAVNNSAALFRNAMGAGKGLYDLFSGMGGTTAPTDWGSSYGGLGSGNTDSLWGGASTGQGFGGDSLNNQSFLSGGGNLWGNYDNNASYNGGLFNSDIW